MASKQVLVVLIVVVTVTAPAPALAADILVGDRDSHGWGLTYFDYVKWVSGNDFIVGDTLVFKYITGRHSVVRAATAASFAACSQADNLGVWTSGDDRIALNASGDWWFFCGVDDHCQRGIKFRVTVRTPTHISLPPSSSPTSDATGLASAQRGGVAAAVLAAMAAVGALLF